ncbi:MAG: penicillin-binding transpeptidase domain-containing protein, partial [Pseudomonadota bacterium]
DGYAVHNFDREYRGWISARQALQDSLNTPAVRILATLGPSRVERWLSHTGVKLAMPPHATGASLPLALGGVGIRLTDLVSLYAAMANEGRWQPLRIWATDPPGQSQTLLPAIAAWQIRDCLAGTPPPAGFSADTGIAFKTGTSYGFRDAWALGLNGRYTVGVWVGRPDGGYAPDQTGRIQAAPLLFQIFALLPPADPAPGLPPPGTLPLTAAQLPPGLREFPARPMAASAPTDAPALLFPGPNTRLASGGVVEFKAQGGQPPLAWLLDGRLLADATWRRTQWAINGPGSHRLTLVDATGRQTSREFWVEPDSQ